MFELSPEAFEDCQKIFNEIDPIWKHYNSLKDEMTAQQKRRIQPRLDLEIEKERVVDRENLLQLRREFCQALALLTKRKDLNQLYVPGMRQGHHIEPKLNRGTMYALCHLINMPKLPPMDEIGMCLMNPNSEHNKILAQVEIPDTDYWDRMCICVDGRPYESILCNAAGFMDEFIAYQNGALPDDYPIWLTPMADYT